MSIRVALHHITHYDYDRLVSLGPQVVRLRPAPQCRTPISSYSLKIEPKEHFINWQQDPQGNYLARLVFNEKTNHFSVEVDLVAEMTVINPFDFFLEPAAEQWPFDYEDELRLELRPFLETPPPGPLLAAFLATIEREPTPTVTFLVRLNARIQSMIGYLIRMEPGVQSSEETLGCMSGSCRDSAWLLVEILRNLGIAARFVSGYLIQLKPDVKPLEGPEGPQDDFTDLHAWTEAYLPGAGWVGLDPTSGLFAGEGHIPLAATPSPQSAAPISGGVSASRVEFRHEMSITRIHEDPRVTKPYTEGQWQALMKLGEQVDAELRDRDVRLTMGGEPTFVSIDDMDGAEWNTEANGDAKRALASDLLNRIKDRFAPGGLLHFGQGKWYPGESLPRWAYSCYWRTDGQPLWLDSRLMGDPERDYGYGEEDAKRFAEALAEHLKVGSENVLTAFEDPLEYIHQERQLPINVNPIDNKLDDPEERERLRKVFSHGLGKPTGFVLPLARGEGKDGPEWQTSLWMLRARHLFLTPGDSPVGLRLPLDQLPYEPEDERRKSYTNDPFGAVTSMPPARRRPLPQASIHASEPASKRQNLKEQPQPIAGHPSPPIVRTALAVEARGGRLYVFLPPTESADDFADLVAALEDTAASLGMPVLIEGYTPPYDPRIQYMKVTPDPGVIEVNVHPSTSWSELVSNTTALYDEARKSRLGTEKFMLDGRHTGTGGGNHLVLGGPTPADSPFLRRPDLLRSLLHYWVNHPSLSYLFSGVFIGPTSQAPRVDETRADAVYELEIAGSLLDDPDLDCPPWLVDRIYRNLLVDVTGNTHRAEFCIDKLYSPDGPTGRLGLVELRGFEMPPHARMSLAQQLLVRSLLALFWRKPYTVAPIRWGTRLHDQFLLPHFVERDIAQVLNDLRSEGYAFDEAWLAPHKEFRFPVYGVASHAGVDIELRQAIEPWYVLGEEQGAGGTARYVDSSVERLQVMVTGLVPERQTVTCNGRRLPLLSTGTAGTYVSGVRYRAWQPPHCLHPTIPVHSPLVFDIVDLGNGRSLGGCTYHVAHPGGRSHETFPVNANEAEARRRARFFDFGHTPGPMATPVEETNPEFPTTLDLRRAPPD